MFHSNFNWDISSIPWRIQKYSWIFLINGNSIFDPFVLFSVLTTIQLLSSLTHTKSLQTCDNSLCNSLYRKIQISWQLLILVSVSNSSSILVVFSPQFSCFSFHNSCAFLSTILNLSFHNSCAFLSTIPSSPVPGPQKVTLLLFTTDKYMIWTICSIYLWLNYKWDYWGLVQE